MQTKALWEDLQNASAAFYPDGLDKCPPDTYTIDGNKNRVRCIECPTCPADRSPRHHVALQWFVRQLATVCHARQVPTQIKPTAQRANSAQTVAQKRS